MAPGERAIWTNVGMRMRRMMMRNERKMKDENEKDDNEGVSEG